MCCGSEAFWSIPARSRATFSSTRRSPAARWSASPARDGPRAFAFVTVTPGTRFEEKGLRAFCRKGLAGYKVPERIVPLAEFPTTPSPNGPKIQRARLRQMAEAAIAETAA